MASSSARGKELPQQNQHFRSAAGSGMAFFQPILQGRVSLQQPLCITAAAQCSFEQSTKGRGWRVYGIHGFLKLEYALSFNYEF
jgi:hypothetical protein